jgi:hypothetical protein
MRVVIKKLDGKKEEHNLEARDTVAKVSWYRWESVGGV